MPMWIFPGIQRFVAGLGELRHELGMVNDRAGDEMGKKSDEKDVAEESELGGLPARCIHKKRDLRKREKRNPEWQRDLQRLKMMARQNPPIRKSKIGVLEECERGKISGNSKGENEFFVLALIAAKRNPDPEIHDNADGDDKQIPGVPPGVKGERHDGQNDIREPARNLRGREIDQQTKRQEDQEKLEAVIEHDGKSVDGSRGRVARFRCLACR